MHVTHLKVKVTGCLYAVGKYEFNQIAKYACYTFESEGNRMSICRWQVRIQLFSLKNRIIEELHEYHHYQAISFE